MSEIKLKEATIDELKSEIARRAEACVIAHSKGNNEAVTLDGKTSLVFGLCKLAKMHAEINYIKSRQSNEIKSAISDGIKEIAEYLK